MGMIAIRVRPGIADPGRRRVRTKLAVGAVLLGLSPQAVAADVAGWREASWSMTAGELRRAFGEALTELPGRRIYKDAYAELAILGTEFLGVDFDVYFQMNVKTDRLQQVLLETGRRRAGPEAFATLQQRLRARHGKETRLCLDRLSAGAPAGAEAVWRFATTTIHAVFMDFYTRGMVFEDPNRDRDPLVPSFRTQRNNPRFLPRRIILRYHPTARADLMGHRCPPDAAADD